MENLLEDVMDLEVRDIRDRQWRRKKNYTKALRKRNMAKAYYSRDSEWDYYPVLGKFIKNKIHCSCYLCTVKRRTHGPSIPELRFLGMVKKIKNNRKIKYIYIDDDL